MIVSYRGARGENMEEEMIGIEENSCPCTREYEAEATLRDTLREVFLVLSIALGITIIGFLSAVGLLSLWFTAELSA
jgi:hypothetical protein